MHLNRAVLLAAGLGLSLSAFAAASNTSPQIDILATGRTQAPNGQWFNVTKQVVDGRKVTTYTSGDLSLSDPEYRAWVKQNPAPRIDPALTARVATAHPAGLLPVAVSLTHNPYFTILAQVQAQHQATSEELDARRERLVAQDIKGTFEDDKSRDQWLASMGVTDAKVNDPIQAARSAIAHDAEALTKTIREQVNARLLPVIADSQAQLTKLVESLGGQVRGLTNITNGASIFIPASNVQQLAADPTIATLLLNAPGESELANQGISLGLTTGFWANGISGTTWDVGQLDSGVQQNHPTFAANGSVPALAFLNGPGRGTTDSDGHGTAVASIMAGRDSTNRGMAFGVQTLLNTAWDDVVVSMDWCFNTASDDPEVVNGSFGIPANAPSVADYTATETYIDMMIRTQSALYTKSAGNLGPAINTLTQPAGIYNGLAVANINDTNNTNRADDFINDSSSRGPTLAGRKKPDLAAPGSPTTAANNLWANPSTNDWITFGGTSSAAPHVAGGVALLTDARASDSPLPIKAILINSADGWDDNATLNTAADDAPRPAEKWNNCYGWGYINLGTAYAQRNNVISSSIPGNPSFRLYKGNITANGRATLTWNRFVSNIAGVNVAQPLTDLDLIMYSQTNNAFTDSSTDINDNVEVVFSATAQPVVLKVDAFSAVDPDIGTSEPFALAHTGGFTSVALPTLVSIATPGTVSPGEAFTFNVIVSNNSAELPAHNVVIRMGAAPAGWTITPSSVTVGTLQQSGGSFSAQFTVTPPCNLAGTSATLSWTHEHNSYGEFVQTPDSQLVTVAPITALTINTPTAVTAPRTYSFAIGSADWYAVAGAEVASRDIDIRGDNDPCITSPWQTSNFANVPDFIFVNGHAVGASTQYAHIFEKNGNSTATTIEYDDALDVFLGSTATLTFSANEPIEPAERSLVLGKLYRVEARVISGFFDPALFLYRPTQSFAERASANASANTAGIGPGARERLNFRALETGVHGFVVTNENAASGTVSFTVRCAADHNSNGVVSVQDIFDFLTDWFAPDIDADINLSGAVSVQDIFDFLAEWFSGC